MDFLTSYLYKEEEKEYMIHRCFEERPANFWFPLTNYKTGKWVSDYPI
jgi:hypothetical protein